MPLQKLETQQQRDAKPEGVQARCLAVGQTLLGSYLIPATVDVPLDLAVNPWGITERSRKFVWNSGDNRRKLITLTNKADRHRTKGHLAPGGGIHEGATWSDGNGRLVHEPLKGKLHCLLCLMFQRWKFFLGLTVSPDWYAAAGDRRSFIGFQYLF